MKKILSLLLFITVIFLSCGGNNKNDNTNTADSKKQVTEEKIVVNEMTVEKYTKMNFELVSMLMEQYYDKLKGKKYEEVKNIYNKFQEENDAIYKKYGVTSQQTNSYWGMDNKVALRTYRTEHPELNYYEKFPEFKEANIAVYHLAEAEFKEKMTHK